MNRQPPGFFGSNNNDVLRCVVSWAFRVEGSILGGPGLVLVRDLIVRKDRAFRALGFACTAIDAGYPGR